MGDKKIRFLALGVVLAAVVGSSVASSQQKPTLKQLEQQAKERLEADRASRIKIEDTAKDRLKSESAKRRMLENLARLVPANIGDSLVCPSGKFLRGGKDLLVSEGFSALRMYSFTSKEEANAIEAIEATSEASSKRLQQLNSYRYAIDEYQKRLPYGDPDWQREVKVKIAKLEKAWDQLFEEDKRKDKEASAPLYRFSKEELPIRAYVFKNIGDNQDLRFQSAASGSLLYYAPMLIPEDALQARAVATTSAVERKHGSLDFLLASEDASQRFELILATQYNNHALSASNAALLFSGETEIAANRNFSSTNGAVACATFGAQARMIFDLTQDVTDQYGGKKVSAPYFVMLISDVMF